MIGRPELEIEKRLKDYAQSLGAKWDGKQAGSFGDTGCFNFFPTKSLGGFGDGGKVTTNDGELYEFLLMLRKNGGKYNVRYIGYNARPDTLQAANLLVKFEYLDKFNKQRRKIASSYDEVLKNVNWIGISYVDKRAYHIYYQYKVMNNKRDESQKKFSEKSIETKLYYKVSSHKMAVFSEKNLVLDELLVARRIIVQVLSFLSRETLSEMIKLFEV